MNLLIGGSGFIGSALASKLIDQGEEVVSIAREAGEVKGVRYLTADLATDPLPAPLVSRATDVFILIGQMGPSFEAKKEAALLRKVLEPFRTGRQRIFYFSSVLVYGECTDPATESRTCRPIGDYPRFKLSAETIAQELIPADRLVIVRLGNVYGTPKNKGLIGLLCQKLVEVAPSITLNANGQSRRDYIFIDDVAGALVAIKNNSGAKGIINVATGRSCSLVEVVEAFNGLGGQEINYQLSPALPNEPKSILVSTTRLNQEFRYNHFIELTEGLARAVQRYQNHL